MAVSKLTDNWWESTSPFNGLTSLVCEALILLPLPSPVFLGATIRIILNPSPEDPSLSFVLFAHCEGTFAFTSNREIFFTLPSFLNFGVLIPRFLGKTHGRVMPRLQCFADVAHCSFRKPN
ncbi:hypothetical protein E4T56_gene16369 [Termitomyces sp. T112]|nr:hypothetical protein E4T56_gene16369 [Termitomyces sp. T112]